MEINQSLRLPRRIADSLRVLVKIVEAVHKSSDLKEIYDIALDLVVQLDKVDMACIYLVDESSNEAVLQAHRDFPDDYIKSASRIPHPKGITWKVVETGKILNIENAQASKDIGPAGIRAGYNGILGVPVMLDGKAIGAIWFARYKDEKFTTTEVELLATIGNQIAIAISKVKQTQELEKINKNLSILSAITEKVHSSVDLKLTYDTFLEMTKDITVYDMMSLYLVEEDGDSREAVLQIHRGLTDDYLKKAGRIPHPGGITWHVIESGEPFYSNDALDGKNPVGPAGLALRPQAYLSIPLKSGSKTMGVIHFASTVNTAFDEYDRDFLISLGNQIGTAIAKAKMFEEAREHAKEMQLLYEDLKSTQDQLIQSEKLASLGQLVSSIAHEINNPLTPILGYSHMLMTNAETDDEKRHRYFEVINQSADKVRRIVENLLSFARKDKPTREFVDVNKIIEKAVEFRQYQLDLENIGVSMELDPDLPNTMADANQLQQVFTNIILNAYHAITHSPIRQGSLQIRTAPGDEDDIKVIISDNGPGISGDILNKVFDPFFTTNPTGVGTGLGLSVSYGIIKEHDGEIFVESEEGKGTTFTICLPVLDYGDYIGLDVGDIAPEEEAARSTLPNHGQKVLIVDDEELVTALISGILESDGYVVDLASNGEEALAKVDESDYLFIVCDIKMPQMNGKEFFKRLNGKNQRLARRILFITGDPSPETVGFIEETGNRFLPKPFKIEEFREAVSSLL
ncbi:MAG: GAF domain-containing protein [Deltaproteobacteria bacterium]